MEYILSYLLDFCKLFAVITGIFGYRPKKTIKTPIIAFASTAVYTALFLMIEKYSPDDPIPAAILQLAYLISVIFAIASLIEGKKKLLIGAAAYMVITLLDDTAYAIVSMMTKLPFETVVRDRGIHYSLMLLTLIIYSAASWAVFSRRKKRHGKRVDIRDGNSCYYVFMIVSVFADSAATVLVGKYAGLDSSGARLFGFAVGLIVIMLAVLAIKCSAGKRYFEQSSRLNEKLMEEQKAYYEQLLSRERETRKFRHDISNHLYCLKTLMNEGKYTEAEEYISKIGERVSTLKARYNTGNDLVSAIVNDMLTRYGSVKLEWKGLLPDELDITNADICVIFSNLLDNAFCAASKCENGSVTAEVKSVANSLMLTIRNDMSVPVKTAGGRLVTSKADSADHGFGTMNVQECVSAFGGSVEYSFTDTVFTAEVVLPNVIKL